MNKFLFLGLITMGFSGAVQAAGTYYDGMYRSPQVARYEGRPQYYMPQQAGQRYTQTQQTAAQRGYAPVTQNPQNSGVGQQVAAGTDRGFYLNAISGYESAMWEFKMNEAGSKLRYSDLAWYVFDVNAGYRFDLNGKTGLDLSVGLKIGMQSGESQMTDDDITSGGHPVLTFFEEMDGAEGLTPGDRIIGTTYSHALSIGTTSGGSMFGYNIGLGLTDFFKAGNLRFTPSIGYRSLNYKLETNNNYGMSMDTAACFQIGTEEVQCDPALLVHWPDGNTQIIWRGDSQTELGFYDELGNYYYGFAAGADGVNAGNTFYFEQSGTSHSYDVTWAGPYLALDMDYAINVNNAVNARVELGLPGYTSTGDQPYRYDWEHPKSVEDKTGMFGALHIGVGASWSTALTSSIGFTIGLTYDYYSVSGADASTYLNADYYKDVAYWAVVNQLYGGDEGLALGNSNFNNEVNMTFNDIQAMYEAEGCSNWVCEAAGEIDSIYKSMGIRVGFNAKF